jgi:hypothetical protein
MGRRCSRSGVIAVGVLALAACADDPTSVSVEGDASRSHSASVGSEIDSVVEDTIEVR